MCRESSAMQGLSPRSPDTPLGSLAMKGSVEREEVIMRYQGTSLSCFNPPRCPKCLAAPSHTQPFQCIASCVSVYLQTHTCVYMCVFLSVGIYVWPYVSTGYILRAGPISYSATPQLFTAHLSGNCSYPESCWHPWVHVLRTACVMKPELYKPVMNEWRSKWMKQMGPLFSLVQQSFDWVPGFLLSTHHPRRSRILKF